MVGAVVGSPRYMAPEAFEGEPSGIRGDIYSLGLILYEMLAGEPARKGTDEDDLEKDVAKEIDLETLPGSPALKRVIARCLSDLAKRYQTPAELKRALARCPDARVAQPARPGDA
jgi:serine/threonine protein kinase